MPRPGHESVVLVTGFPSLYARRMIEVILAEEPSTFVYVAAEPKSGASAAALAAAAEGRVEVLEARPTAIDLGLSGAELRRVAGELDRIHHVVHTTDASADKKTCLAQNTVSAAEIIEVARLCKELRCLVLHSTAAVSGGRQGVVREADLDEKHPLHSAVTETRARAEVIARRAMGKVPIAVVRPTTIIGEEISVEAAAESSAGPSPRLSEVHLLALLLIAKPADLTIPLPGRTGDVPLHVVPLDYVARAARLIGRSPSAPGRTFHLVDPSPPPLRRFIDLVSRASRLRERARVPSDLARVLLRTPGIEGFVRSPRAFIEGLMVPVRYDAQNTADALAGTGVECPPFESYVDKLVASVEAHIQGRRELRTNSVELEVDDPLS